MRGLSGLLVLLLAMAVPAIAQPDLSRRVGTTVADTGAPGYRFERVTLASEDGREYRLNLAVPLAPPPAAGYPAVWLLDGNAALMETPAALVQALAKAPSPPLLVFVAHDNDLRIDGAARAHDYTPRLPGGDAAQVDPMGRRNGGADGFLDWLTGAARERVRRVAPLDDARQAIWGHSYGGVFVLHALFSRPEAFDAYAAVDPSLWWGDGYLLKEADEAASATDVALWLAAGENVAVPSGKAPPSQPSPASGGRGGSAERSSERSIPGSRGADRSPDSSLPRVRGRAGVGASEADSRTAASADRPDHAPMRRARDAVPPGAAKDLVERQKARGVDARYVPLPGLSHGQTLGASLPLFLRAFAGLAPP
ncbi:alpha/beta hydrolase [Pseudoxanthomonas beigongshangi]